MEYFPANTLTNFKTKLAQPIELTGEWEVALCELQYLRSWYNLRKGFDSHINHKSGGQGYFLSSGVPHAYHRSVKEFVGAVNKTLKTIVNGDIWFMYNQLTRKMTVHVKIRRS